MDISKVNLTTSRSIYKELMQGRVINRIKSVSNNEECELFGEIFNNFNHYKMQYSMAGYELVAKQDFYYIRQLGVENAHTEATKEIQSLLLIIGRHITKSGYLFEKLTNVSGGLDAEQISRIDQNEEYKEILEAIEVKDLHTGIKSYLVGRGIMEELPGTRFVLTCAGKYFFEDLWAE